MILERLKEKFDLFGVNNRIMLIMKEKNLNKNSLSKLLGLSQPALLKIETNKNLPSFKLLFELIKNFPDISPEWLLTGNGNMLKESIGALQPKEVDELVDVYKMCLSENEDLKNKLNEKEKQVSDLIKMNLYLLERENDEANNDQKDLKSNAS